MDIKVRPRVDGASVFERGRCHNLTYQMCRSRVRCSASSVAYWTSLRKRAGWISLGSGKPTVQQPWESAAAVGTKTHRLIQQYGHRYAAPAASDPVSLVVDRGGNRWIAGKFVDLSSHVTDSDYFMGFRPVEPGNTQILSRPAEFSTASTSFVDVSNPFQVTR